MTIRIVDTPIGGTVVLPPPREDRFRPELLPAIFPGADAAVARLADALVVTTGQQPGLFTGPLYAIHKALSARALAQALEARTGRAVVPVFWVAGDDHDFAEASVTSWLGADGAIETAELVARPTDAPLTPMYREPVPAEVAGLLERLEATLPPGPPRDETVAWLRRHYRPGETLAGASGRALAEVLGGLGVVCLDAAHPAVKRLSFPTVLAALERTAELDRLLVERTATLDRRGIDPGVKVGDGATLVMLEDQAGRDRLVPDGAGWKTRRAGQAVSRADLERIARDEPERISPNVLLRPVVESAILPTVAYVAGPGELKYLELAQALYHPLGVVPQRLVPRWSGVLVEPRVSRTLEKFELELDQVLDPDDGLEAKVVRSLAPSDFDPAFTALRAALEAGYERIAGVARAIDPTLEKPATGAKGQALVAVADLEKKLLLAQKRRQGELLAQLERARNAVRPLGRPQERVLGLPSFAGRYGAPLLTELADHVARWYASALEAPALRA